MHPDITQDALIRDVAIAHPETVAVFQRHQLEFCCAGAVPIAAACRQHGIDVDALLGEIDASLTVIADDHDWRTASLTSLVQHIQQRYHESLREELPRLTELADRVLSRHGETYPDMLEPLHADFRALVAEAMHHLQKEEMVLFPAIITLDTADMDRGGRDNGHWAWIDQPIRVMSDDHAVVAGKLQSMRTVTNGYTLPPGACPTFRGLFHGLQQLERDLASHMALEDDILFPRAAALACVRY